ncbi:MAG TPA: response regulator transcription factor [Acidimicrobiales bacterium]|jgi:DNA-binding NarL/FixJ family response regulator|nr:response regulator transcription factor [Acidimicrobiales bacterium]
MTITVVVADDQALVRAGFRVLVNSASDLEVVGVASDGVEAVEVVEATRPDVVLMDVRMPKMDGLEATRQIVQSQGAAGSRVLMVTTFDLDEYIFDALRFGASGFVLKDTPPDEVLAAIRVIAQGDSLLAPSVTRRLIAEFASRPADQPPESGRLDSLTEREREVLTAIGKGYSNAEIAEELSMSLGTAKTHVSRILAKLQARDRTQLVVIAFQSGLVAV